MAHSVAELQAEIVAYELEGIDRMYLNCYVPKLSSAAGVAGFIRSNKLGYDRRFRRGAGQNSCASSPRQFLSQSLLRTEPTENRTIGHPFLE